MFYQWCSFEIFRAMVYLVAEDSPKTREKGRYPTLRNRLVKKHKLLFDKRTYLVSF